jgi:hypothetical protein
MIYSRLHWPLRLINARFDWPLAYPRLRLNRRLAPHGRLVHLWLLRERLLVRSWLPHG